MRENIVNVKCNRCKKDILLIADDLLNHRGYMVCPYCSSKDIKVIGAFDDFKECIKNFEIDIRKIK